MEDSGFGSCSCHPQCWGLPAQGPARWRWARRPQRCAGQAGRGTQKAPEPTILGQTPPATSRDRSGIYSRQRPPRVEKSSGAMAQAVPLRSPSPHWLPHTTPHSRGCLGPAVKGWACGEGRCSHPASPRPRGEQVPLSAWQAPLPQAVWPGPCLSPPPQVGIPSALSARPCWSLDGTVGFC